MIRIGAIVSRKLHVVILNVLRYQRRPKNTRTQRQISRVSSRIPSNLGCRKRLTQFLAPMLFELERGLFENKHPNAYTREAGISIY